MNKIELDFTPDVIVFFHKPVNGVGREEVWGDENFYKSIIGFVNLNMIKDILVGWVFIKKFTLEYKVICGGLYDSI